MKHQVQSRSAICALLLSVALCGVPALSQQEPTSPVPITIPVVAPVSTQATGESSPARSINPLQSVLLQEAIKEQKWEEARTAIAAGADVNAVAKDGVTSLMRAAAAHQSELVTEMLQAGANPNALDKKGRSALHYAIPEGHKPKKKKFGFGQILNMAGGMGALGGGNSLGGLGSVLGGGSLEGLMGSNLASLLGGSAFDLGGKSGWTAIAGAALQGDASGQLGIGSLLGSSSLLGGLNTGSLTDSLGSHLSLGGQLGAMTGSLSAGNWTSLLSSVKSTKPEILQAMGNLAAQNGTHNTQQSALWNQFLTSASSGDEATVSELMTKPELAPLLQQASKGLGAAASELPGNASRSIVTFLLQSGAKAEAANREGDTPAQLAKERGLPEIAALFGA